MTRFDLPPPNPGIARLFRWVRLTEGHADVLPDVLEIRYGWAFSATVPRSSIVSAVADDDRVRRYGANRHGNLWSVIPDAVGVVRLTITPPAPGKLAGFRSRVGDLRLAVADRDGFLEALGHSASP